MSETVFCARCSKEVPDADPRNQPLICSDCLEPHIRETHGEDVVRFLKSEGRLPR